MSTTVQGSRTTHITKIVTAQSAIKGKSWHSMQPTELHKAIHLKPQKLKDVIKLLTDHFGKAQQNNDSLYSTRTYLLNSTQGLKMKTKMTVLMMKFPLMTKIFQCENKNMSFSVECVKNFTNVHFKSRLYILTIQFLLDLRCLNLLMKTSNYISFLIVY